LNGIKEAANRRGLHPKQNALKNCAAHNDMMKIVKARLNSRILLRKFDDAEPLMIDRDGDLP
jgi:hypothetical protein